jgi:transposase
MITITRALNFNHTIFLEDTNLTILTRQEKERLVLDLYNQGKTYREISKEVRISPRDIGIILNKVMEEKIEAKAQQDNNEAKQNQQEQQQQQHLSLSNQTAFDIERRPIEGFRSLSINHRYLSFP